MILIGKKSKLICSAETCFLFLMSYVVVYYVLLVASKTSLFELSCSRSYLGRWHPYLELPYLLAVLLGMAIGPLVWEKAIRKIEFKEIGFSLPQHFGKEVVFATGLFLLFAAYSYLLLSKRSVFLSWPAYVAMSLCIRWLVVAFGEEILYRGIIQRRLSRIYGKYCGLILASALFAFVGHLQAPLIDNTILRLPFGLILGYSYLRSSSLLIPIVMHWSFNAVFAS